MATNGHCENNKVKVVLGAQWGDEGKGKLVDLLAENADIVARCQVNYYDQLNSYHVINKITKQDLIEKRNEISLYLKGR